LQFRRVKRGEVRIPPSPLFKACDLSQAFSFSALPTYRSAGHSCGHYPSLHTVGKWQNSQVFGGFRLADVNSGRLVWGQFGGNVYFALGRWRVAIKTVSVWRALGHGQARIATSTIALNMNRCDYCHGPGAFQV
jgi:hypothetical protein